MAQCIQMYRPLSPCSSCQRHVLASASSCPFCGADIAGVGARDVPSIARMRMSRRTMALLGASLALTACSSNPKGTDPSDPPQPGPPDDDGAPVAEYGAPAPEPAGPPDDDAGADKPMYGVPAPR